MERIKVIKIKDIKSLYDLHESRVEEGKTEPWNTAIIVFKQQPEWKKKYTEEQRSYLVGYEYNKFFRKGMLGSGLFGSCLYGSDMRLRLNNTYYPYWSVEKVYTCEVPKDE